MPPDEKFTLEKLRVADRLTVVEQELKSLGVIMSGTMGRMDALIAKHNETIYGNGKDGMVTEISNLKQSNDNRTWFDRMGLTTCVGLIVKVFFDAVKH